MSGETPILQFEGLTIAFQKGGSPVPTVSDVSFEVGRGEIVCLLGESGSGKSLTCLSVLDILPPGGSIQSGTVRFDGVDISQLRESEKRAYRGGRVAMVFQDPVGALNPAHKIGVQLRESLRLHSRPCSDEIVAELLARVGLYSPERVLSSYPHELSGGMNQRVMIAMALSGDPDLLIADEPTTALDATIQAQVLDLLRNIQQELGLSVLLVTHDIGVAGDIANRIVVMRHGRVVEIGETEQILTEPRHDYTRSLIDAARALEAA